MKNCLPVFIMKTSLIFIMIPFTLAYYNKHEQLNLQYSVTINKVINCIFLKDPVIISNNSKITVKNINELRLIDAAYLNDTIRTQGYYSPNDGGSGRYLIRKQKVSDVDDGGAIIFCSDGLIAQLIFDKIINIKQYGAVGDGKTNDSEKLENAFGVKNEVVFDLAGGVYFLKESVVVKERKKFALKNGSIFIKREVHGLVLNGIPEIDINEVKFFGESNSYAAGIHIVYVSNINTKVNIRNCEFSNRYYGISLVGAKGFEIANNQFSSMQGQSVRIINSREGTIHNNRIESSADNYEACILLDVLKDTDINSKIIIKNNYISGLPRRDGWPTWNGSPIAIQVYRRASDIRIVGNHINAMWRRSEKYNGEWQIAYQGNIVVNTSTNYPKTYLTKIIISNNIINSVSQANNCILCNGPILNLVIQDNKTEGVRGIRVSKVNNGLFVNNTHKDYTSEDVNIKKHLFFLLEECNNSRILSNTYDASFKDVKKEALSGFYSTFVTLYKCSSSQISNNKIVSSAKSDLSLFDFGSKDKRASSKSSATNNKVFGNYNSIINNSSDMDNLVKH